jgi:hypothetical protein
MTEEGETEGEVIGKLTGPVEGGNLIGRYSSVIRVSSSKRASDDRTKRPVINRKK